MALAAAYGIRLFNERRYFEAHEALEEIWLKERDESKTLLHGLIQIAAAFHHYSRANLRGFRSLMNKGCAKLASCGDEAFGAYEIDRRALEKQLDAWRLFLNAAAQVPGIPPPPLPKITAKRLRP